MEWRLYLKMFVNILLVLTIGLSLSESANVATVDDGSLDESKKIPLDPTLAWQSTNYDDKSTADKAVNDICSQEKKKDWTSATEKEKYPGWAIDLGKVYYVEIVAVRTRMSITDGSGKIRFHSVYAFVWDNKVVLDNDIDFSKSCAYFKGPPAHANQNVVFPCKQLGRFAGIVLKQDNQWLEICQVKIYGILAQELSLDSAVAWQSSTFKNDVAEGLIKGNCIDQHFQYMSSTKKQKNPALAIDLKQNYNIDKVIVTTRNHEWKFKWFHDAYLFVFEEKPDINNIDFTKSCFYFKGPPSSKLQNIGFSCGRFGRFVTIALKQENQYLEICKISIYSKFSSMKLAKSSGKSRKWAYVTGAVVGSLLLIGLIAAAIIIYKRKSNKTNYERFE